MEKSEVSLLDLTEKLEGVNIYMDKIFLSELLKKASGKEKPHCNLDFISKLGMKLTTRYLCTTIYGWGKYKPIPLKKLGLIVNLSGYNFAEVEKNILSIGTGRIKISPSFPIKIDKRLGSIAGHIMGDGSIDKKLKQVFFSNSEKELLKEFDGHMNSIFNVKPRIWMQKKPDYGNTQWDKRLKEIDNLVEGRNCGLFYLSICGLILNAILDNFAIGKDKKITGSIMNANKEFKRGFIRAFYDDESTVGKKNIRLFQDRKEVLEGFRGLLSEFGISASTVKRYLKHEKERFYFDIFKKSNFAKFRDEIGFTSSKKNTRLQQLCIIKNLKNSK